VVEYGSVGQVIIEEVNHLYKKVFQDKYGAFAKSFLLGERMDHGLLKKAEDGLVKLEEFSNFYAQNSGARQFVV